MNVSEIEMAPGITGMCTCNACPTQWSGHVNRTDWWYFRHRFGRWRLSVNRDSYRPADWEVTGVCGNSMDGEMPEDLVVPLIVALLAVYQRHKECGP